MPQYDISKPATRAARLLSTLLIIGSVLALGAAISLRLFASGRAEGLVLREPERVLNGLVAGKTYNVKVEIVNPTRRSKRVFGGNFFT
jgi:hypothetical protein